MLASVRAGFAAALVAFFSFTAFAADKSFQRSDLADSAVRLEAQIKAESGQVAKPVATLRSEADAAFAKRDFRSGMQSLAQIVAVAPRESGNWLRLARAILQIRPSDDRERVNFLERAATAAYIAYQRSGNTGEEADALVLLGRTFAERKLWRPALDAYRYSLDLREVADVRQAYEQVRDEHGFRILDYSVDADAASPRACFQFSEDLPGKRADFSPFVALEGTDKPAITTEEKQLCVEGLKHGERYSITLRAGLPSTVRETLQKSAEYNIYVRDRSPYVRFTGKAYVLPRVGQRGIPVVSVNTAAVSVQSSPHRRPQPARHGAGRGFPAQHLHLRARPARHREGRARLERRAEDRLGAQRRRHHRLPDRSGDRRSESRHLRDDRAAGDAHGRAMTRATASSRRSGSSSPISG